MAIDSNTIRKSYGLSELLLSVESMIRKTYWNPYWIRCEIARISVHAQSGHCYLELVEKNERGIIAQIKAMIWSDKYTTICKKFEETTGTAFANGMQVMFACTVSFHPLHGMSLMITDIEPSFTLGELARMKNEAILRLKKEGLFDLNKKQMLPKLPVRIAVISVDTSRGYQDFLKTLASHSKHYNIRISLFDAILQGENAVPTIISALIKIAKSSNDFDAIAIIRGGAGETGLSCYDEFDLAKAIAMFPLPVLTGIGHATNETVVEMVSHQSFITPTAAAQFLIDCFEKEEKNILAFLQKVDTSALQLLERSKQIIRHYAEQLLASVRTRVNTEKATVENYKDRFHFLATHFFSIKRNGLMLLFTDLSEKIRGNLLPGMQNRLNKINYSLDKSVLQLLAVKQINLNKMSDTMMQSPSILKERTKSIQHLEEKVNLLSPANTLKRGYSITRMNGKSVLRRNELKTGDNINIELSDGTLNGTVTN